MREMKDSGIEWLGEIPAGWEIRQVGQLAEVVKAPNEGLAENNLLSLSYGKIRRRDINAVDGLLPASFETYNIIQPNDIVLRFTDLQNDQKSLRVGRATERGIITSAYVTVRPHDAFRSRFIYYALHAYDLRKGFYGMGAGVRQGLKWQEARYIRLPWPGEEGQRRIADYLDEKCAEVDRAISAAEQSIEELMAYRSSRLEGTIEAVACSAPRVKLKYVLEESKEKSDDGIGEPLSITIARGVLRSSELSVPNPASSLVGSKIVRKGDLVFNKLKAYFGVMYVSPYDGLISSEYAIYRALNPCRVSLKYLEYVFHTAVLVDEFKIRISGVADGFRRLYTSDLFDIAVGMPPIEAQEKTVSELDGLYASISGSIEAKQAIISDLKAYKQSLIYEVVTGKREV